MIMAMIMAVILASTMARMARPKSSQVNGAATDAADEFRLLEFVESDAEQIRLLGARQLRGSDGRDREGDDGRDLHGSN